MALSDEKREQIRALLATGMSKNSVAKQCGVSWATVEIESKKDPDKFESFREQKRMQFVDRIWSSMDEALKLGDIRIQLAKNGAEKLEMIIDMVEDGQLVEPRQIQELSNAIAAVTTIPLSHISTYFGTLYDKQALMKGESTNNTNINGTMHHKHVMDMSDEDLERIANGSI